MAVSFRNLGGTMNATFTIGKGGPLLRNNTGVLEVRNNANSAYAGFRSIGIQDAGSSTAIFVDSANHVGIGAVPSTSGALEITSTNGALIVPRMSTAQRDAMTIVNGMIVYSTTSNQLFARVNGTWVDVAVGIGGINNVVEDTTPQLGGDLDANTFDIQLADGAALTPSLTFGSDLDTGLYSGGLDVLGIAAGGVSGILVSEAAGAITVDVNGTLDVTGSITLTGTVDGRDIATDGLKLDGIEANATANPNAIDNVVEDTTPQLGGNLDANGNAILLADGAVGTPSLRFGSDPDNGLFLAGVNSIGISIGGLQNVAFSATNILFSQSVRIPDGAVGTPSLSFGTDPDTGIYHIGADSMGISIGGVLGLTLTEAGSAVTITSGGTITLADNILDRPLIRDYAVAVTTDATFTGAETLDYATGNVKELTLTGNVTSITINNWPASGREGRLTLYIHQDSTARTITWPAAVTWGAAGAPDLSTVSTTYVVVLTTLDGGTTIYGFLAGSQF